MVVWTRGHLIGHRERAAVHRLIELENVDELLRNAESFPGGNGLVVNVGAFARSILKFSLLSVGEVFGYQMAAALGVRVARMQGFWTREAVDAAGTTAEPGRIGVLVEHLADWIDLDWDDAASVDRGAVARALSLCAFDCSEWGSFGQSGGELYFADLERLTPLANVEELLAASHETRIEILDGRQDVYDRGHSDMIHQVVEEADSLDLNRELHGELKKVCSIGPDAYSAFLKLVAHPIDALLSRFAASMFGRRLNAIAEHVGQPTHEAPTWR
jgi:hypothetical protein